MELYMMNRQHGRIILESVENGPLIWHTIEENGVTRPKKYSKLSATEATQADCDQGDDLIDSINYMMSFLSAVVTSSFPTTNKQLRNSSNPRQQAIINDGRVAVQPVQGRQISFATGTSRTYTPAASRNPRYSEGQAIQHVITHNAAYQADDLDVYDFDCDELNTAKVALMANLSHYGSDALTEVHNLDNVDNSMINLGVQVMSSSEQSNVVNQSKTEITSDNNVIPYS
nr:hypothetical protein [Tanacetum cinerariifolium]